jgi:hypothetical protein
VPGELGNDAGIIGLAVWAAHKATSKTLAD